MNWKQLVEDIYWNDLAQDVLVESSIQREIRLNKQIGLNESDLIDWEAI